MFDAKHPYCNKANSAICYLCKINQRLPNLEAENLIGPRKVSIGR